VKKNGKKTAFGPTQGRKGVRIPDPDRVELSHIRLRSAELGRTVSKGKAPSFRRMEKKGMKLWRKRKPEGAKK